MGGERVPVRAACAFPCPFAPEGAGEIEIGRVRQTHDAQAAEPEPGWQCVEELLRHLATTHATFASETSDSNWISEYAPGYRLRLETQLGAGWIRVSDVRACWETFERLGRISRCDVLEPGRRSAFMMALFRQIDGVRAEVGEAECLVLPDCSVLGPS